MKDSHYDIAQICTNGHVINTTAGSSPQLNQKYCSKCGAETITSCPSCNTEIQGHYFLFDAIGLPYNFQRPLYCSNCGAAYPWTTSHLRAAAKQVDGLEVLSLEEKEQLKSSLHDLVKETPQTPLAETQFKKLMKKAGAGAYETMRSILISVVSDAVQKKIFGG
jgi:hypothetical protein